MEGLIVLIVIFSFFIIINFVKNDLGNDREEKKTAYKTHHFYESNDEKELKPFPKYAQTEDDIAIIQNNLTVIGRKISEIEPKLKVLMDNNKLLKADTSKNDLTEIINKNSTIINYLLDLHDQFIALRLELLFSKVFFYLRKQDIKTIKIKSEIEELQKKMNGYIYDYFPSEKPIDDIIITFKFSGQTIKNIMDNINTIKIKLVMLQNKAIMSDISPIEIERELNTILSEKDYSQLSINLNDLNNEYDRFVSEYEVTG